MKKKIIYISLVSVLLILAVVIVISRFGKKTTVEETTGDTVTEEQTSSDVPEESTEDNSVPETLEYELVIPDIQGIVGDKKDIVVNAMDIAVSNERIYEVAQIYNSEQQIMAYKLVSFKPDGSDIQFVELEEPSVKMTDDMVEEILFGQDGNVYAIRSYNPPSPWSLWYSGNLHILVWGADGTLLSESALEVPNMDDNVQIRTFNVTKEGNIALLCGLTDGNGFVIHIRKDGSYDGRTEMVHDESYTSWWNANDGTFVAYYGERVGSNGQYNYYYKTYDIDNRMFSEKVRVIIPGKADEYIQISGKCTGRNIIIMKKDNYLYRHDVNSEEIKPIVNIKNAGYEGNDFHDLVMMNDDILVWRYQNLNNQYNNIVAILIPKQK